MDDLDLSGNRFNVVTCIFFAPYCLFGKLNSFLFSSLLTNNANWGTQKFPVTGFSPESKDHPGISAGSSSPGASS